MWHQACTEAGNKKLPLYIAGVCFFQILSCSFHTW